MSKDSRDIVDRFGERVRQLREAKGMGQIALSEKMGVQQPGISLVETGKQEPCLRYIDMLATALDISLSELFKGL